MRSIQEAPQSNRGGPGRVRRRCVVADPGCGDREFATSSDVADGRSSLPQDGDPEVCAREVSTRVGQVSGLNVHLTDWVSDRLPRVARDTGKKHKNLLCSQVCVVP